MRFILIAQLSVLLLAFCGISQANAMEPLESETHEEDAHGPDGAGQDHEHNAHGEEHAHTFFAGVKGSYVAAFAHGSVHHLGGGGVFFEVLAIPHWLEIELFVRAMVGSHAIALPIDLVFKVPFHLTETVHPFVGLGATVIPYITDAETEVFFGGLLAVGSYFWINSKFGVVAELNYNLVYEHGIVNEIGANAGLVFGW